ncbi:MAG: ATP synthase F1 subunit epsilon [Lachnospiraceae bacterium]|jgi:F-type H+-transporting ATPase subunit epsilon|nr:ATP synthase F1 subunit epsilon [Lachnospiraceae bacterium]
MSEENKEYRLRIVTPERVFYEGPVEMVEFNTTEGQIGVLPGHIPMTVIVSPGILTITEAEGTKEAALHAGFAEILPDQITILAEIIEWPDEIDKDRAEYALQKARERLENRDSQTDLAMAETALQRAIARIEVLK